MRFLLALGALVSSVLAASRTSPPSGALSVGSGKTYTTVQSAVNALSKTSTSAQSIFIYAGTYNERVVIPALKGPLKVYGYTTDTASYASNVVNIQQSNSQASGAVNNEATATVDNQSPNTSFYNINIKNTYGKGSQAIALAAYDTNQGYYGVGFYGYQDTLLAQEGNQFYGKCYIEGAVDFIFGQRARIWIDGSDIRVSAGDGAITANGREDSSGVSYYVINKSSVGASSKGSVAAGSVYLGRPWRAYARVTVQNTVLSNIINAAGWQVWQPTDTRTTNVQLQEYGNTGAGAAGTRASFSSKASSAVTIASILGSSYTSWVDTAYIS